MSNNIIELENVNFSYSEDTQIIQEITLSTQQNKITAILGSSGCGKTTLLRLISSQILPNRGSLKVFGKDLAKLSMTQIYTLRMRLGMLFQFGALFTDMTVAQNIAFPLQENTNLSNQLIKRIVAMKLESVGLTGTQDFMPNQLSGGMARRVALARSQVMDPELMLYDEPFTGLDPISLNTTAMLIKKLNHHLRQTSILVTHDIAVTMQIADYLYFMENGKIIEQGTPKQIRNTTNPSVKQFVNGQIEGPFSYQHQGKLSYEQYLGIA